MHAKLTRDRKKMFTSRLQQMITALERQNQAMRNRLQAQIQSSRDPVPTATAPAPAPASGPPQPLNLQHRMPLPQSSSFVQHVGLHGMPIPHPQSYASALPMFIPQQYVNVNSTLLQSLGLPPNFNMTQALTMAPPLNVNAYAPLALKRKAYEATLMQTTSSSSPSSQPDVPGPSVYVKNE